MTPMKQRGARRSKVLSDRNQAKEQRERKQAARERVRIAAPNGLEPLLDEHELAAITGLSVSTVRLNRVRGSGCPFVLLGALIRYRPEDVRAYIAQNLRQTSGMPGAVLSDASTAAVSAIGGAA